MKSSDQSIYYFLGNITSHILHALPLHEQLGGTFVVLSKKAEKELAVYNVPILRLQNSPRLGIHLGLRAKKTTDFLNQKASLVLFYELFTFAGSSQLTSPRTVFLTHGNMLKNYMGEQNRVDTLTENYDYMAALGPVMKDKFISLGIPEDKLLEVGVARTDQLVSSKRSDTVKTKELLESFGYKKQQKIVTYVPTYWGDSSVYETGLDLAKHIAEDYFLIVRPHPQTKKSLLKKYQRLSSQRSNVLYAIEGAIPNLGLIDVYAVSDVIVGDVSSVMLEALFLDTPLIFAYGHGRHRQSASDYEDIVDVVDYAPSIDESSSTAPNQVIKTALQQGINKTIWNDTKQQMFYGHNGDSVSLLIKTLRSL